MWTVAFCLIVPFVLLFAWMAWIEWRDRDLCPCGLPNDVCTPPSFEVQCRSCRFRTWQLGEKPQRCFCGGELVKRGSERRKAAPDGGGPSGGDAGNPAIAVLEDNTYDK